MSLQSICELFDSGATGCWMCSMAPTEGTVRLLKEEVCYSCLKGPDWWDFLCISHLFFPEDPCLSHLSSFRLDFCL